VSEYRDARSASATDNTYKTAYEYDDWGNQTKMTDPAGGIETRVYYPAGVTGEGGTGTVPVGNLRTVTDRTSVTTEYKYDRKGDQIRIIHPASGTRVQSFDEIGRLMTTGRELSGAIVGVTTNTYDVRSRLATATGPQITNTVTGQTRQTRMSYKYWPNGMVQESKTEDVGGLDPARVSTMTYDANDRLDITTTGAKTTNNDYDFVGRLERVTDPRGVQVKTTYNSRDLPTSVVMENFADTIGGATRSITLSSTTYSPTLPLVDEETDAIGRVVQSTYWPDDRLKQQTLKNYAPLGETARPLVLGYFEYDVVGNQRIARRGVAGSGVSAAVSTIERTYDARNFMLNEKLLDIATRVTTFTYDLEGRRKTSTTGGLVSTNQYNAKGQLVNSSVGASAQLVTGYGYDTLGRQTITTDPKGYVTTTQFDIADRPTTVTSPAFTAWDATGATSASAQAVVAFGYNAFGEKTHVRDPRNQSVSTTYDNFGRPTLVTYPTESSITPTESFSYDLSDNQVSSTDRRGAVTTATFDAMSRARVMTAPAPTSGAAQPVTSQVFNDVSQLTQVTDPNGNITKYTYDVAGKTQHATAGFGSVEPSVTTMGYDDLGNLTISRDGLNNQTTMKYDAASSLLSVTDPTGAVTQKTYQAATGLMENTVVAGVRRSRVLYDVYGRVEKEQRLNSAGTAVMSETTFGYDWNSNKTSVTRPNGATDTFTYDQMNRLLTSVTDIGMVGTAATATSSAGYDIAGNLVRVTDARGYVSTMAYNNWGLLKETVEPSTSTFPGLADRRWSVGYNAAGQPTSELRPGGVSVSRVYDSLGRLTSESATGSGITSAARTLGYDAGSR
jgi:YD repeat-containing protein